MSTEALVPPFEIYDDVNLADANGHICSCESREIAEAVLSALQHRYAELEELGKL